MDTLVVYTFWIVAALIGLGLLAIAIFGIRNIAVGKVSLTSAVMVLIPVLILIVLGLVMDSWAEAGIMAALISMALATLALLVTGLRSMVG